MKISNRKNTWISVGCGIALLSGAPAMADDTELLLITPDPRFNPKPNVMFILDTSGSMGTTETTIQPYDNTITYSGACDVNALYWTDVDVLPICDVNNTQWIDKVGVSLRVREPADFRYRQFHEYRGSISRAVAKTAPARASGSLAVHRSRQQ